MLAPTGAHRICGGTKYENRGYLRGRPDLPAFRPYPQFKVYDTENGNIVAARIIDTGSSGHGALADLLQQLQVEVLICGGIGGGAQAALRDAGIALYGGVTGDADDAVADFLAGQLAYNPCVRCNHHGEGHSCGSHCGSH